MDDQPPLGAATVGDSGDLRGLLIALLLVAVSVTGLWHWCGNWLKVAALTSKRDAT